MSSSHPRCSRSPNVHPASVLVAGPGAGWAGEEPGPHSPVGAHRQRPEARRGEGASPRRGGTGPDAQRPPCPFDIGPESVLA